MKRLSKNFLTIIGSDVLRRLLGFLTVAYLARKVGSSQFGVINIGFTVLTYALMVSSLGLNAFGARSVARNQIGSIVNKIISIRVLSGLISFVIVIAISLFFISDSVVALIIIVFCLSLFANAFLLDWFFQGKEQMGIIGVGRLVSAVVYLLMILLFVHSPDEIVWVAIAAFTGDLLASLISWSYFRKNSQAERFKFTINGWKEITKSSISIGIGSILAALSVNLPPIVLGIVATNQDVGIYSAASKLVFFILMLDRVFATLLLPASARLHNLSPDLLTSTLSFAMRWIIIISIPLCMGGVLLAHQLIPLVYGLEYSQAIVVFQILIWFFFATFLHTIYTSGMIAIGQEKSYSIVMMISTAIYFISIVGLTKYYGVTGSAAAMVVSEIAGLFLLQSRFNRFVKLQFPSSLWKIILSACGMGIVLVLLSSIHVLLLIPIAIIVYFGFLFITKAVTQSDIINLIKRI